MLARPRRVLVASLAIAAVGAGIGACTIADSLRLPDAIAGDSGSPSETGAADAAVVDPCRRVGFPEPPSSPVGLGGGDTYYFATSSMDFGKGDGGVTTPVGLNLDMECTCPDPESCVPLSATSKHCDKLGLGIDNTVALLANGPAFSGGYDLQGLAQRGLSKGRNGLLFRMDQYNGEANDSAVTLSFYVSDGPATADGGGVGMTPPAFTLADLWTVDRTSLVGGTDPTKLVSVATTGGYVADWVAVATNLTASVRLDDSLTLDLKSFTVAAKLAKDPTTGLFSVVDGTFAGRWSTRDALRNLGNLSDVAADGGKLCENPTNFAAMKAFICPAADISATGPDNTNVTCDALSLGVHFTAVPATFGAVVSADSGASPCSSAGADYTCTN